MHFAISRSAEKAVCTEAAMNPRLGKVVDVPIACRGFSVKDE